MTSRTALVGFAVAALALPAAAAGPTESFDPEALALVDEMSAAAAGLRDYTMTLVRHELRERTTVDEETLLVKWQRPQRIYLKAITGLREGQEVLFAPGWNKDRIKVHKGSFPDITLNLSPYGTLAMAHAHHPVPEISLVRLVERVADNVGRARAKGVGSLRVVGRSTLFGRSVVEIEATAPPTGTTPTLAKGQTLWDIARATGQSIYVILHANQSRGWTQVDQPRPGDAVIVPDFYAGRMDLWIDEALHLPLQADLYDHDGRLYEHYEHRDLAVNVGLKDADFDPRNKAYRF